MKKLLTSLLALLTCFACATAVACGESGNNSSNGGSSNTGSNSDTGSIDEEDELQDAADYLEALYKEENLEMSRSYDVIPAVLGYPITWTVDVETGVTIKVEDNKVTVDIDASLEEDVTYVLTATLTDGERTVSVSFTRVAKAVNVIPVAITKAPVAGTAYKYHLYQANLGKDLYFAGAMDGYYFATTETVEKTEESAGAVDVYVEYAAGSTTNFYLYFTDAANVKQYISVEEAWNSKNSYWTFNVVFNSTVPVSTFVWSEQYQTVITTVASRSKDDNKNQSAEQTTTQTLYIGTYKTYDTFSASTVDKAATSFVGHLVEMVDKNSITPDVKVAEVKEGLALAKTEFVGAAEVELPVARHADVAVAWACESEFVSIADGKLTITAPTAETTVTLTATLTCGEVSDTTEFTLTLKPAVSIPAAGSTLTIPQANEIGVALGGEYTEGMYYVSGVVSSVKNTQYGNLYIKDADGNEFYVYGVYSADGSTRYDAMENAPQVGDTITVYGIIGSYNGSAQMKDGWMTAYTAGEGGGTETPPVETPTYSTPEEILTALYGLADGESLTGPFTLTGKITALDSYNNPTIVVEGFEDKPVYCYKLKVTNAVGDTITVTAGSMKNYGGTYEFMDCTLVTEDQGGTETPPVETPTYSTPEEILTALYGLADGESLTGPFTLTGKITELDSYNNPTIVVEGFEDKPVYCYRLKVTNAVGDTITVTAGSMKNYGGTYEFMDCTLVTEDQGGTEEPPVETPVEGAVTISIADVAAANSWANGTRYEAVTYNGVTFTTAGTAVGSWGLNTGKYYDSNKDWRVYQNEGGTLTITAEAGKTIASVKITYNNKNGGVILHNEAQVTSGTVITVNANSLTIGVGSSSGATNGNIQITSIEIVYAE